MKVSGRRFPLRFGFLFPLFPVLMVGPLIAQEEEKDFFDFAGNMFVQSFYLARDLPLERPEDTGRSVDRQNQPVCPGPDPNPGVAANDTTSRCREEEDFTRMRMRVDFALQPSQYVDILYGLEVGYIEFGRESGTSGPGSGGKGAGRTNLETRQMIMRIHNQKDTLAGQVGVYSLSTPEGMVLASSGAGVRFNWDLRSRASRFEANGIRAEDNSKIDDDSNGFSDDNFKDIYLATGSWNYSGISWLDATLYGVYRGDDDPAEDDKDGRETSRVYWLGLFGKFTISRWRVTLHGIVNQGRFERPDRQEYLSEPERLVAQRVMRNSGFRIHPETDILAPLDPATGTYRALPRHKYRLKAHAAHAELGYKATNRLELIGAAAGGSGRPGRVEPDRKSTFTREDQFRRASGGFQFSEIGVDSSGGYSLFSLTGTVAGGAALVYDLDAPIQLRVGYFYMEAYRSPVMDYNLYHTRYPFYLRWAIRDDGRVELERDDRILFSSHPGLRSDSKYLGHEWNAKLTWRIFSDLTFQATAAVFTAGDGYRALRDVQYGSSIGEAAFSLRQTF